MPSAAKSNSENRRYQLENYRHEAPGTGERLTKVRLNNRFPDQRILARLTMDENGSEENLGCRRKNKLKQADRPDFVTASGIATLCYDNHSSRRRITPPLKLSTRTLREPPQRVPI